VGAVREGGGGVLVRGGCRSRLVGTKLLSILGWVVVTFCLVTILAASHLRAIFISSPPNLGGSHSGLS
jgi:hypothetical protein